MSAMVKIAIAGLSVGPIYIFRNVAGSSRFGHTSWRGEPFLKMGGAPLTGGGRAYVFHNTILQPPGPPEAGGTIGCAEGLNQSGGPELLSVVSRAAGITSRRGTWRASARCGRT